MLKFSFYLSLNKKFGGVLSYALAAGCVHTEIWVGAVNSPLTCEPTKPCSRLFELRGFSFNTTNQ